MMTVILPTMMDARQRGPLKEDTHVQALPLSALNAEMGSFTQENNAMMAMLFQTMDVLLLAKLKQDISVQELQVLALNAEIMLKTVLNLVTMETLITQTGVHQHALLNLDGHAQVLLKAPALQLVETIKYSDPKDVMITTFKTEMDAHHRVKLSPMVIVIQLRRFAIYAGMVSEKPLKHVTIKPMKREKDVLLIVSQSCLLGPAQEDHQLKKTPAILITETE